MRRISPEEQKSAQRFDISVYWRIFLRRKHFLIIPILIAGVVVVIGSRFLIPMYEAGTVIRYEDQNILSHDVAQFVQVEQRRRIHDSELLSRIQSEIKSNTFIDQLIQNLGLLNNVEIRQKILANKPRKPLNISLEEFIKRELREHIRNKISFANVGPGLFEVSFIDYNPEACYVIADAIAALFIEVHQIQRIRAFQEASEFSDEQLVVYKEQLEKSEKELEELQRSLAERKLGDIPVTELNIKYAETLERQFEINVDDSESIVERIRQNLRNLFGAVPSSETILSDTELLYLEKSLIDRRETELLMELGESGRPSADFVKHQDIISETHASIQHRLTKLVSESYPNITNDYRALVIEYFYQLYYLKGYRGKLDKLRYYIDKYRENLNVVPQMERRINQLKETVESNRTLYNAFLGAKTSAQISEAVQSTNLGTVVEIVEAAVKPLRPVKPNKMKLLFTALIFSGVIGVGSIILVELSNNTFETVEEVEEMLGLKVLGTIPRFEGDEKLTRGNVKKRVAVWVTAALFITTAILFGFYYSGKYARTHFYTERTSKASISQESNNDKSD